MKADAIADTYKAEIISLIDKTAHRPKLVGILTTSSVPSRRYAEYTQKMCVEHGIEFILKTTGAAKDKELDEGEGVEEAIMEANNNDSIDGILVRELDSMLLSSDQRSFAGLLSNFWGATSR